MDLGQVVSPMSELVSQKECRTLGAVYTTRWKLSDILFGFRSRSGGVAGVSDFFVGSIPSSLFFRKASTHGVRTRIAVKSLYTPSVR